MVCEARVISQLTKRPLRISRADTFCEHSFSDSVEHPACPCPSERARAGQRNMCRKDVLVRRETWVGSRLGISNQWPIPNRGRASVQRSVNCSKTNDGKEVSNVRFHIVD